MNFVDIPARLGIPFARDAANPTYKRDIPNTTADPGRASWTQGFPASTMGVGSIPPAGRDFNGVLNHLSSWVRWLQAGGPCRYDAGFAAEIGGYPDACIIQGSGAGVWWRSTVNNNMTDPDSVGASGWVPAFRTGSIVDNMITNPKLADMANQTLKGRISGGTGDPEDIPFADFISAIASNFTPTVEVSGNSTCVTFPGGYARQTGRVSVGPDNFGTATFLHTFASPPIPVGCSGMIASYGSSDASGVFIESDSISSSSMRVVNNDNALTWTVTWYAEGFLA